MATTAYADILRDWVNLVQLDYDTLLTDDAETFRSCYNIHLRKIWNFTNWPEVMVIEEWGPFIDNEFDYSDDTDVGAIINVWEADPRIDRSAEPIRVHDNGSLLYVLDEQDPDCTLWVQYITAPHTVSYGGNAQAIPSRFVTYVLYNCVADWYMTENEQKSQMYRQLAEIALLDEAELLERRMGQLGFQIGNTYPHGKNY